MFGAIFGFTAITIAVALLIPILIVGVVIWAIRRSAPARRDPAEEELRDRLARGEMDTAEFEVRLRTLREGDQH